LKKARLKDCHTGSFKHAFVLRSYFRAAKLGGFSQIQNLFKRFSMDSEGYALSNILILPGHTITSLGGLEKHHLMVGILTPRIFDLAEWLNPRPSGNRQRGFWRPFCSWSNSWKRPTALQHLCRSVMLFLKIRWPIHSGCRIRSSRQSHTLPMDGNAT
jgi:hypothetical protein